MTRRRTQCFPQTSHAPTIPGLVTIAAVLYFHVGDGLPMRSKFSAPMCLGHRIPLIEIAAAELLRDGDACVFMRSRRFESIALMPNDGRHIVTNGHELDTVLTKPEGLVADTRI
jgi:hypothetical protein